MFIYRKIKKHSDIFVAVLFLFLSGNLSAQPKLKVEIEGLEGKLLKNARVFLQIYQQKDAPNLTTGWINTLFRQGEKDIGLALQPFGYYQVKVDSSLSQNLSKSLSKKKQSAWTAYYHVTPGPQVRISSLDIKWLGAGASEAELQQTLDDFPIKTGEPFNHQQYEDEKANLLKQASLLGYPQVRTVVKQVRVDPEKLTAEIKLHLDTGDKFYIGKIRLEQDILSPKLIQRYIRDIHPGDPYSQETLLELQQALATSGYFSIVDVNPKFDEVTEQKVPIDVGLSAAKRHKLSLGLGYDTDIQINGTTRWQNRRFNTLGHNTDVLLKLSQRKSTLRGSYWIPGYNPHNDKFGLITKFETEKTDSTDRNTLDLEAAYVFVWKDWASKLFSEFKYERFASGAESETSTHLLSIGGRTQKSKFEKTVFPRKGWGLFADIRGAPTNVLSDTHYLRTHFKSIYYYPLAEKGRLNLRAELGFAAVDDFDKYPNSLRFFAGGDASVRGYEWKSLGPKDSSGEVIGGKNIFTASLEYDHRVLEDWVAAVFVDAGNAYNDELDKIYTGAGVGVRWLSPVGSIRMDFAWPLDKDDEDLNFSSVRIHFGFEVML